MPGNPLNSSMKGLPFSKKRYSTNTPDECLDKIVAFGVKRRHLVTEFPLKNTEIELDGSDRTAKSEASMDAFESYLSFASIFWREAPEKKVERVPVADRF